MKLTGLMEFGGKTHLVYTLGDTQYVSLRPIVDQIGLDWRTQKKVMLDDDNVLFYGTLLLEDGQILQAPCKYDLKNAFFPSHDSENVQKPAVFFAGDAQKDTVFIRLRRVQMYIARISIGNVRGRGGNESAAEFILALHEEWAEALHEYETNGIAIKQGHSNQYIKDVRALIATINQKDKSASKADSKRLAQLIDNMFEKLGYPYQLDEDDEE